VIDHSVLSFVLSQIFIDYGEEWEKAWNDHVKNWRSPCKDVPISDCLQSSQLVNIEMNRDRHNKKYHSWSDVHLSACQVNSTHPWEEGEVVYLTNSSESKYDDPDIKYDFLGFTYQDDGFDYPYLALLNPRPCKVLESYSGDDTLDVVIFFQPFQVPLDYQNPEVPDARVIVRYNGLPGQDFRFINKPLKADWHDPNAFRHEIHIPDESFPKLWRDLGETAEDSMAGVGQRGEA